MLWISGVWVNCFAHRWGIALKWETMGLSYGKNHRVFRFHTFGDHHRCDAFTLRLGNKCVKIIKQPTFVLELILVFFFFFAFFMRGFSREQVCSKFPRQTNRLINNYHRSNRVLADARAHLNLNDMYLVDKITQFRSERNEIKWDGNQWHLLRPMRNNRTQLHHWTKQLFALFAAPRSSAHTNSMMPFNVHSARTLASRMYAQIINKWRRKKQQPPVDVR